MRSEFDSLQLSSPIREALRNLDASLPVYVDTWSQGLELALFPSRMAAIALGVMGLIGAMLSITGIFGMAAYSVSKRLRELGIRMALGAQRKEVLRAALEDRFDCLLLGRVLDCSWEFLRAAFWLTLCFRQRRAILGC